MDEAIPGNWILIATGVLVEASMALWTWPIEAEAIGVRSKDEKRDRHSEPSSVLITFYRCSADPIWNARGRIYLHLPIRHVICMRLNLL